MKKLLCMIIAVVMVLSMGVVAFAEENNASIEVGLGGMIFEKGSAKEFIVTIYKNSSVAPAFAFDLYFGGDVVPSKLEIQREGTWEPVAVGEGGKYVVEGIKFSGDEYSVQLRATFNESGKGEYGGSLLEATALVNSVPSEYTKIVDGFDGGYSVIGSVNPTFNPTPAEDPVIVDLDGADEAEEEANPNTGALVLVPAVVALAAVTGIMVSKRK